MINKFQQGGLTDAIMQFVQLLSQALQADPLQIILIAQLNPNTLKMAVLTYQLTLDINQAAQAFSQEAQKSIKAAHGAKLNYIKSLKHKCADDEELVYYKKGGMLDCGCQKKKTGGEVTSKKESAVDRFRKGGKPSNDNGESTAKTITNVAGFATGTQAGINRARKEKGKNVVVNGTTKQPMEDALRKKPKFKNDYSSKRVKDSEEDYMKGRQHIQEGKNGTKVPKNSCGGFVKKSKIQVSCGGSKLGDKVLLKKGNKVCPKCGKIHEGSCK